VGRVRQIAPDGVDLALDTAGRGALPDLIEITGSPDNVVTIADYNAHDYGVRLSGGGERSYQALGQAARLFEEGEFSMPVAQTFPLEQAAEAHRVSQDGHVRGKLVLIVDEQMGGA
jgi:NADPH:quinone reductase-like Zn-dependent oxidoreductase